MNAVQKIDRMKPFVSSSVWSDLLEIRALVVRFMDDVQTLSHEVIDSNRPMFQSIEAPKAVEPLSGIPVSQDEEE